MRTQKILFLLKTKIAWRWVVGMNLSYVFFLILIVPWKDFTLNGVIITVVLLSLFNGAAIYKIVDDELKKHKAV